MSTGTRTEIKSIPHDFIRSLVFKVLNKNSGGCKLTALITEVLAEFYEFMETQEVNESTTFFKQQCRTLLEPENLEKFLKQIEGIKLFYYHMNIEEGKNGLKRQKIFVGLVWQSF